MNNAEAKSLLAEQLAIWHKETYSALAARIGDLSHTDVIAPSGSTYQVDVQVIWDDKPGGLIRVLGSVDDGGLRAFVPLNDDFLIAPDGSFVGE